MSRDEQIEKMAKVLCEDCAIECSPCYFIKKGEMCNSVQEQAKRMYAKGYRKSEDVAREIFEEIEKAFKECLWFLENHPSNYPMMDRAKISVYKDNLQYIAELKKKYTESEKDK